MIELFHIGMPVVRTDGRAGGRSVYGHVITQFSPIGSLPHFFTHGAPLLKSDRINGFFYKKMYGRFAGPKKSGHNNEVTVSPRWS